MTKNVILVRFSTVNERPISVINPDKWKEIDRITEDEAMRNYLPIPDQFKSDFYNDRGRFGSIVLGRLYGAQEIE